MFRDISLTVSRVSTFLSEQISHQPRDNKRTDCQGEPCPSVRTWTVLSASERTNMSFASARRAESEKASSTIVVQKGNRGSMSWDWCCHAENRPVAAAAATRRSALHTDRHQGVFARVALGLRSASGSSITCLASFFAPLHGLREPNLPLSPAPFVRENHRSWRARLRTAQGGWFRFSFPLEPGYEVRHKHDPGVPRRSLFVWLVADGWCWFVLREKYCWLIAGGWFVLR
jgi:hypothetical protein